MSEFLMISGLIILISVLCLGSFILGTDMAKDALKEIEDLRRIVELKDEKISTQILNCDRLTFEVEELKYKIRCGEPENLEPISVDEANSRAVLSGKLNETIDDELAGIFLEIRRLSDKGEVKLIWEDCMYPGRSNPTNPRIPKPSDLAFKRLRKLGYAYKRNVRTIKSEFRGEQRVEQIILSWG